MSSVDGEHDEVMTSKNNNERDHNQRHHNQLLLGIDGGGSKTTALIASLNDQGEISVLGCGRGGPSNLRLAGTDTSLANLNQALDRALAEANITGADIDCSVLALAGSSSDDIHEIISTWAASRGLRSELEIVHDILPVLVKGAREGWGVALIVGTGSVAMGVDAEGRSIIRGGWGHWFGDKGSGFGLGSNALSAVVDAADEIGPPTLLSELVLARLGIVKPRDIIKAITSHGDVQHDVAALAPVVLEAASLKDEVASGIVNDAVTETLKLVSAVIKNLAFTGPYPLALAGGVACHSQLFRRQLIARLEQMQPPPASVTIVNEPVMGCLEIARAKLHGS